MDEIKLRLFGVLFNIASNRVSENCKINKAKLQRRHRLGYIFEFPV